MDAEPPPGVTLLRRRLWRSVSGLALAGAVLNDAPSASAATKPGDRQVASLLRSTHSKTHRALDRLLAGQIEGTVPDLLGREAADPHSPLRQAIDSLFQSASVMAPTDTTAGAGLLPPSSGLYAWDTYHRSDRGLPGDTAPSGQVYSFTGDPSRMMLSGNRYAPAPLPHQADVLFVNHPQPVSTIAAEFCWIGGATDAQNVVIGSCPVSFGVDSLQLAVHAGRDRSTDTDWTLFCVQSVNGVLEYPVVASGQLAPGFSFNIDNATRYRMLLHRSSSDTVLVQLPDGQVRSVSHPMVSVCWGPAVGLQLRRPHASDGYAAFTGFATSI